MKRTLCAIAAIAGLMFANTLMAQEQTEPKKDEKKKKATTLSISNEGIRIDKWDSTKHKSSAKKENDEDNSRWKTNFALVDLGVNILQDNTDYTNADVKAFLNVPTNYQNKSLFDLRTGKSINVNIYPWMIKYAAVKTHGQRIYVSTGLGLQLYNFRFEEPITFTKHPSGVILDTITFKKNKLAMDYLNVPLMLTFKTRLHKDTWLVYGAGITEGFRIASWTKQISGQRGKEKVHDAFGLADFNTCLSAEFGIDGVFRFYATYQLTSMYEKGLDQHPICFGLRFSGI